MVFISRQEMTMDANPDNGNAYQIFVFPANVSKIMAEGIRQIMWLHRDKKRDTPRFPVAWK